MARSRRTSGARWTRVYGLWPALAVACAPTVAPLVPPPDARAALLVIETEDALEVSASDLASAFVSQLATDGPTTLTALFYRDTLAELGVLAGPQELVPEGRALPPGWIEGQAAILEGGALPSWSAACAQACPVRDDPRVRIAQVDPRRCASAGGCGVDGASCEIPCAPGGVTPPTIDARAIVAPSFAPCPAGWTALSSTRAPELVACIPGGDGCAAGEAPFVDGCAVPCIAAPAPPDAIHVAADELSRMLTRAPDGAVLMLDPGVWTEDVLITRGVRVLGACPARTSLTGAVTIDDGGLTDLRAEGPLTVRGATRLDGIVASGGVSVEPGARLDGASVVVRGGALTHTAATGALERVVLDAPLTVAGGALTLRAARLAGQALTVRAGASLTLTEAALSGELTVSGATLVAHDLRADGGSIVASSTTASVIELRRAWFERPTAPAIALLSPGGRATIEDVVVMDAGSEEGAVRAIDGAAIDATRLHVQGGVARGVVIDRPDPQRGERTVSHLDEVRVLDMRASAGPREAFDCGVCLLGLSDVVVSGLDVARVRRHGLVVNDANARIDRVRVRDVDAPRKLTTTGMLDLEDGACIRLENAVATLEQVDVEGCVGGVRVLTRLGGVGDVHLHHVRAGASRLDSASAIYARGSDLELAFIDLAATVLGHGLEVETSADVRAHDLRVRGARRAAQTGTREVAGDNASIYLGGTAPLILSRFDVAGASYGVAIGAVPPPAHQLDDGAARGDDASVCMSATLDTATWAARLSRVAAPDGIREPGCVIHPYVQP